MFVYELEGPDMLCGEPVLSLVISQCEPSGVDTHQETHQIIFCFWPGDVVSCGAD